MNGQRIHYPHLASELLDSVNALSSIGRLPAIGDGEPRRSIVPSRLRGYETCLTLEVAVGGSAVRVHLDGGALEAALAGQMARQAFETLDDDLKMAVLETTLTESLTALSRLLRAEIVLQRVGPVPGDPGADAPGVRLQRLLFEVCRASGPVCCTVLLELTSPLSDSVLARLAGFRGRRDCGGLPIPVTFELGCASLSHAELRSLEAGDIVLFDRCYIAQNQLRVNICNTLFEVGTLEGLDLALEDSTG